MSGITYEKNPCRCLSCDYLLCSIKKNFDEAGNYDLKIYCQVANCPVKREEEEIRLKRMAKQEAERKAEMEAKRIAHEKITACMEMLKRCIELKKY